jgi:hypothetical protein
VKRSVKEPRTADDRRGIFSVAGGGWHQLSDIRSGCPRKCEVGDRSSNSTVGWFGRGQVNRLSGKLGRKQPPYIDDRQRRFHLLCVKRDRGAVSSVLLTSCFSFSTNKEVLVLADIFLMVQDTRVMLGIHQNFGNWRLGGVAVPHAEFGLVYISTTYVVSHVFFWSLL